MTCVHISARIVHKITACILLTTDYIHIAYICIVHFITGIVCTLHVSNFTHGVTSKEASLFLFAC